MPELTDAMKLTWADGYRHMALFRPFGDDKPLGRGPFTKFELIETTPCDPSTCKKVEKSRGEEKPQEGVNHAPTCKELFRGADHLVVLKRDENNRTRYLSGKMFKSAT